MKRYPIWVAILLCLVLTLSACGGKSTPAPVEEQPNQEQPNQEQPNQEQPNQEQPNSEQPNQEQPGEQQPNDEQPDEVKKAEDVTSFTGKDPRDGFDEEGSTVVTFGGLDLTIPAYFGEKASNSTEETIYFYEFQEDDSFAMLSITANPVEITDEDFAEMQQDLEQSFFAMVGEAEKQDNHEVTVVGKACNLFSYTTCIQELDVLAHTVAVNETNSGNVVWLTLMTTDGAGYDYFSDYVKILNGAQVHTD